MRNCAVGRLSEEQLLPGDGHCFRAANHSRALGCLAEHLVIIHQVGTTVLNATMKRLHCLRTQVEFSWEIGQGLSLWF